MRLFASIAMAPLKVADAIRATGSKTLSLASFGVFRRHAARSTTFSREGVRWYHWPFVIAFGLAMDNLFIAVGLAVWAVLFYVIALAWVALFGSIPPVHTW